MNAMTLTPEQLEALGGLADNGQCRLCALGLPDRPGPVVAHFDDSSVVLHEDAAMHRVEQPSVDRRRAA